MQNRRFIYITSWPRGTGFQEAGVRVYAMDGGGTLHLLQTAEPGVSFGTAHVDPRRGLLYALNETDRLPGLRAGGGGRVFVFCIDRETGLLSLLGVRPTWCVNPAYLTLDASGDFAVVANHGGGAAATKLTRDAFGGYHLEVVHDDAAVELFAVGVDGMLGELLDADLHLGGGPEARQVIAHPHCAVMSPDGGLFAVCDKGNDTVSMYRIDAEERKLRLAAAPLRCAPGSLPRYCVFHPVLPYFYHNNENRMELSAYRYGPDGVLTPLGESSSLPAGFVPGSGRMEQQGLCIHPGGGTIYDVARGPNQISVFRVDPASGLPSLIQSVPVDDGWPRGCAVTGDGQFLIVCGLETGLVSVHPVGADGTLGAPVCALRQPFAAGAFIWTPAE